MGRSRLKGYVLALLVLTMTLLSAGKALAADTYDVWVGGVQVTDTNKDNVLAGTANDGMVTFTPADATAGTSAKLTLGADRNSNVSVSGVADEHHGAAIQSDGDITITVPGIATLTGASCTSGRAVGIYSGGSLTLYEGYSDGITVTAGDSVGSVVGDDFSAAIFAVGDISMSNCGTVTATGGGGMTYSYGVYAMGSISLEGNPVNLNANGGAGTSWSIGIRAAGDLKANRDVHLIAHGADVSDGSSIGIFAQSLTLAEWTPIVEAYGGAATSSSGVIVTGSNGTGITIADYSTFVAQGADAEEESFGIFCINATDLVSVSGSCYVKATGGATDATSGTSEGILGQLSYQGSEDEGTTLIAASGAAQTSKAFSTAPQVSGSYRWLTDTTSTWQDGTTNPYRYSGDERSVTLEGMGFLVWVAGRQVTMSNMGDVLGDGKVSFVPATDGKSLGTLSLDNASITYPYAASPYSRCPAIYSFGSLTIDIAGKNTVVGGTEGANSYNSEASGIMTLPHNGFGGTGDSLTVTGDGTLNVSATAPDLVNVVAILVGNAGKGSLTVSGKARVIAAAPTSQTYLSTGVEAGDITLADEALLRGTGGENRSSVGINGMYSISISGDSELDGFGADAMMSSSGVLSSVVKVSDEATLVAHGGSTTGTRGVSCGLALLESEATLDVSGGTLDLRSGSSVISLACNKAPNLMYAPYQWKTADADLWTDSTEKAYSYDVEQTYIRIAPVDYDVSVGGVEVNSLNKDDVLGDGTVSFTPSSDGKSLGTLSLNGAHVEGGIRAGGALAIDLMGDNAVNMTGDYYDSEIAGIQTEYSYSGSWKGGYAIAVTGSGSLVVNSSTEDYADRVIGIRAGEDGNDDLTISDSAHVNATAANGEGATYGVWARNVALSGSSELDGLTSGNGSTGEMPAQSWGIFCDNLSVTGSSKVVGRGCDASFECYGIVADQSAKVADDATLEGTSGSSPGRDNDGISMGLSGALWDSTPTFVVTGGTVSLESGSASISEASDVAPDLSGYASYRWKIAEGDALTPSTKAAYSFDKSQTYIQIVPAADEPVTPVPGTPTPETQVAAESSTTPETGDGMAAPLAAGALAMTLAAADVFVAVRMRRSAR